MLLITLTERNLRAALWAVVVAGTTLTAPPRVAAQAQSSAEASPTPSAARMIILPRKLVARERATLAVLDIQGRLTPDAIVEFSSGAHVRTDSTGRAAFDVPTKPKVLFAHLQGRPDKVSSVIVQRTSSAEPGLTVSSYPRVVARTDRFDLSGSGFSGTADANGANAGGTTALILAASPLALVLMPAPGLSEGPSEFSVETRGQHAGPFPITFVSLEVSATKHRLAANERGVLTVRVRGSDQRLLIEARNLTPEIVALARANALREVTSGGEENVARFELSGLRTGAFSISVRLVPTINAPLPKAPTVSQPLPEAHLRPFGRESRGPDRVYDRRPNRTVAHCADVCRACRTSHRSFQIAS